MQAAAGQVPHLRRFDGADWVALRPDLDGVEGLGVGTASDAVNRLAVASEAVLFTHAGAGHRLTVNKAAAADTASLLFQTGWSGRAEMGTAGSDDFAIKVSADGSAWTDALVFDGATGAVSGAAVQGGPTDTAPGRLALASHAYGPGNLLGTVAQAGGVPTGAAIESGSGAGGRYTRFADGMQILVAKRTLVRASASVCTGPWSFPAAFAAAPSVSVTITDPGTAAPGETGLAAPRAADVTATEAELRAPRTAGAADFAVGDTVAVSVIAVGRWV